MFGRIESPGVLEIFSGGENDTARMSSPDSACAEEFAGGDMASNSIMKKIRSIAPQTPILPGSKYRLFTTTSICPLVFDQIHFGVVTLIGNGAYALYVVANLCA